MVVVMVATVATCQISYSSFFLHVEYFGLTFYASYDIVITLLFFQNSIAVVSLSYHALSEGNNQKGNNQHVSRRGNEII